MRFFGWVQVLTGAIALWAVVFADAGWAWWGLALFGYFLYGCVGLSVGFHRYFAHRRFEAPRWAVIMFQMLGVMGCFGAVAGRAVTHRRHHRHADRPGDPHRAKALGWRALVVGSYEGRQDRAAVRRELRREPVRNLSDQQPSRLADLMPALPPNLLYRRRGQQDSPNSLNRPCVIVASTYQSITKTEKPSGQGDQSSNVQ